MSKKTTSIIFAAITSLFAFATVANASSSTQESPAAVDACNGKSDGDNCTFTQDKNTINGTCQRGDDGKTICVGNK